MDQKIIQMLNELSHRVSQLENAPKPIIYSAGISQFQGNGTTGDLLRLGGRYTTVGNPSISFYNSGTTRTGYIQKVPEYFILANDNPSTNFGPAVIYNTSYGGFQSRFEFAANGIFNASGSSPGIQIISTGSYAYLKVIFYGSLGADVKGRLLYAGENSAGSRWFGLSNDNADYIAFYTSGSTRGMFITGVGDVIPVVAGVQNLGNATNYWNDVSYKTLTDRGCLFDTSTGIELKDGRKVSNLQAIKRMNRHPNKKSVQGEDALDYSEFPKHAYKPAPIADEDIYELVPDGINEKGETKQKRQLKYRKGEKAGEDGVEMTAVFSMMLGAIKELTAKVEELEEEVSKLKEAKNK